MYESALFSLLWTQVWQVTVVALLVWALVKTAAQNRPHLAHSLWLLVLLKALTPPVLASPTSPFCWIGTRGNPVLLAESPVNCPSAKMTSGEVNRESINSAVVIDNPAKDDSKTASTADFWKRIQRWLIAIWVSGTLFAIVRLMLRYILFLRWTSRSTEHRKPQIDSLIDRLRKQIGTKQPVRVRVLDIPVGPAVLGFFHRTILLPESIVRNRTDEQLEPLLAHELVHLRRGDLWWAVIQSLARCLLWFHPLVHLAERQLTSEAERSCDEETIASLGCSPAAYARCLLNVLELKHQLRVAPALPGVRPVDVTSARLERVMRLGKGCHRKSPAWVWLVLLLGCVALLPGAALVLAQEPVKSAANKQGTVAGPAKPNDGVAHVLNFRVVEIDEASVKVLNAKWKEQEKLAILESEYRRDHEAASHITTKSNALPVHTAVFDLQGLHRLSSMLETTPNAKQIFSPTLMAQSGRAAEMLLEGKEVPFVTDYEKLEKEGLTNSEKAIAWQPKVEFALLGWQIQAIPTLQENGELQIDVQLCHSILESAESVEFEHDPSQKVSRPVVVKSIGRATVIAPKGGGLAIKIPQAIDGKTALCIINWSRSVPVDQLIPVDIVPSLDCREVFNFPGEKPEVRRFVIQRALAERKRDSSAKAEVAGEACPDSAKQTNETPELNPVTIKAVKGTRCRIDLRANVPEVKMGDPALVKVKFTDPSTVELEFLKAGNTRISLKQVDGHFINVDLSISDELSEGQLLPKLK